MAQMAVANGQGGLVYSPNVVTSEPTISRARLSPEPDCPEQTGFQLPSGWLMGKTGAGTWLSYTQQKALNAGAFFVDGLFPLLVLVIRSAARTKAQDAPHESRYSHGTD